VHGRPFDDIVALGSSLPLLVDQAAYRILQESLPTRSATPDPAPQ